jgi:acetyl-CoA synthetase
LNPARPRAVLFVSDLPKTRNGKVMRRIARAAYIGENLGDTFALDATAIEAIKERSKEN